MRDTLQTHLICRVPEYHRKDMERPAYCQIVAVSGGKVSDPQDFVYKPGQCPPRPPGSAVVFPALVPAVS